METSVVIILVLLPLLCAARSHTAGYKIHWSLNPETTTGCDTTSLHGEFLCNGQLTNAPKFDYSGLSLEGNQSMCIPYAPELHSNSFTVMVWARNGLKQAKDSQNIFAPLASLNLANQSPSGFSLYCDSDGFWGANLGMGSVSTNQFCSFDWQHIALSYDSTTQFALFFLNGVAVGDTLTGYIPSMTPFCIGATDAAALNGWQGQLHDAAYFNYALPAHDVRTEMLATQNPGSEYGVRWPLTSDSHCDVDAVTPLPGFNCDGSPDNLNFSNGFLDVQNQAMDVPFSTYLNTPSFSTMIWAQNVRNFSNASGDFRSPITSRWGQIDGELAGFAIYCHPQGYWFTMVGHGDWVWVVTNASCNFEWTHVALTCDSSSTKCIMYINGEFMGSALVPDYWVPKYPVFRIGAGCTESDPKYYWQGALHGAAFFNFAMTIDEVNLEMQRTQLGVH